MTSGIPIGAMGILVGLVVLTLWIPLRERQGLGTVLNVLIIGIVIDLTPLWLATPEALWRRTGLMLLGPLVHWYLPRLALPGTPRRPELSDRPSRSSATG